MIFDPSVIDNSLTLKQGPLCSALLPYYELQLYHSITINTSDTWSLLEIIFKKKPELAKLTRSLSITRDHTSEALMEVDLFLVMELISNVRSIKFECFMPLSLLSWISTRYEKLQTITLDMEVTPEFTLEDHLELLEKLPKLHSIHLGLQFPEFASIMGDGSLPSSSSNTTAQELTSFKKIKSLEILTDDFSDPELLEAVSRFPPLQSLHVMASSEGGGLINFNPFLAQLNTCSLESLIFTSSNQEDQEDQFVPSYINVERFIDRCKNLKKLIVGIPVISDLSSLARLEELSLLHYSEITLDSIRELLELSQTRDSKLGKLELSSVWKGEEGTPIQRHLFEELLEAEESEEEDTPGLDEYWEKFLVRESMSNFGWYLSTWIDYDRAQAQELIESAARLGIEVRGKILEGIAIDGAYQEEFEKCLEWMQELRIQREIAGEYHDEFCFDCSPFIEEWDNSEEIEEEERILFERNGFSYPDLEIEGKKLEEEEEEEDYEDNYGERDDLESDSDEEGMEERLNQQNGSILLDQMEDEGKGFDIHNSGYDSFSD